MTEQTQFFEQKPLLPGPAATNTAARRVFYYDGQAFEDPGAEYSVQDVLNFLSGTYPELKSGTWNSRTLPDGTEEITFVKVPGEKGITSPKNRILNATGSLSRRANVALKSTRSLAAAASDGCQNRRNKWPAATGATVEECRPDHRVPDTGELARLHLSISPRRGSQRPR